MSRTSAEWLKLDAELAPDHLARVIDRGVDCLELSPLLQSYKGHGSKPHRPDLMLKVVLFEIERGRSSPTEWFVDAKENKAVQWLGCGIQPSRSVWYEFAFRIQHHLDSWNRQVLQLAQEQDRMSGKLAALDGTTIEAHASRHRLLNQEQMEHRRRLLDTAIEADEKGAGSAPFRYWMSKTPRTRRLQKRQYELAHGKLAERLAENRKRLPSQRQDEKNVRISVSDPDAALGKDKHRIYRPLYNVQYVRDVDSPFILAYGVFARSSDTGTLVPMLERTRQMTGHLPEKLLADSGYITALDLLDSRNLGVDLYGPWKENDYSVKRPCSKPIGKDQFQWDEQARGYRCPQGVILTARSSQNRKCSLDRTQKIFLYEADAATCAKCALKQRCCPKSKSGRHINRSEHEGLIQAHRRKMETPEAKALYKQRSQTVETSFADSKQHRCFRRITGRGLCRAKTQTALVVLAHNLTHLASTPIATRPP